MEKMCRIATAMLVLTLLAVSASALAVTAVTSNSGEASAYIELKINSTGMWLTVPAFNQLVNLTYSRVLFGARDVNSDCIYFFLYTLPSMEPANARVDIYAVNGSVAYHVVQLYVSGSGTYCNSSLENYSEVLVIFHYNDTNIPVAVLKPGTVPTVPPPTPQVEPYIPLMALAVVAPVGFWFNLRKTGLGLIVMGTLFMLLGMVMNMTTNPWWTTFSILQILLGIAVMVIVEKYPESE